MRAFTKQFRIIARHHVPLNDLHACLSQELKPLKSRIPDVLALPKSIPFHPPILAGLHPLLARN